MQVYVKYFGSVRHNSTAEDAFAKVVNVMNHTELSDAETSEVTKHKSPN